MPDNIAINSALADEFLALSQEMLAKSKEFDAEAQNQQALECSTLSKIYADTSIGFQIRLSKAEALAEDEYEVAMVALAAGRQAYAQLS